MLPTLSAGGAERVLITLTNNLDRSRFAPELVALSGGPIQDWVHKEIPVHVLHKSRARTGYFSLIRKLRHIKPDVVISTIVHMNALALLVKPFLPKAKFIVREASLPTVLMREYGLRGALCRYVYQYGYPHADLVISPSGLVIEEFRNVLKMQMKKHKTLFNPVDTERILTHIPPKFIVTKERKEKTHFVAAGRLSYEKGFDRLIMALQGMKFDRDWRLDILGEGEQRAELERLIKKAQLQNHVFLQGYQKNPWEFMAQADYVLLPSRWEGMPNVVLESLVCGTPVIAMEEAGGIVEIQGFCEPGKVQISKTIEGFVELMKSAKPEPKKKKDPSLLPSVFFLPTIMRRLESWILEL